MRTERSRPRGNATGVLVLGLMSMAGFLAGMIAAPTLRLDPWTIGAAGMVPFALLGWWAGTEGLRTVALTAAGATVVGSQLGTMLAGVTPMDNLAHVFGTALLLGAMALAARARTSTEGQREAFARLSAQSAETEAMLELQRAIAGSASALLTEDPAVAVRTSIRVVHAAVQAEAVYVTSYGSETEDTPVEVEWFDGRDGETAAPERPWFTDIGLEIEDCEYVLSSAGDSVDALIPITAQGIVSGVMGIVTSPDRRFTGAEEAMLRTVAELVGVAWDRRRTAERLERLLQSKDRFIASVSHELRTPLAVIVGLSLEMRDDIEQFDEEEVHELMSMIAQQGGELRDLVEDLLVGARAEEAQLTVLTEDVDLADLVPQVLDALPSEVLEKVSACDMRPPSVVADPLRLRQIIRNLVINAHRHGGPDIHISAEVGDGFGLLSVSDNGTGVPEGMHDTIFAPYGRASADPGRPGSIGLGLTVSRQLARLMGGDIVYRKDSNGTTFEVSLPLSVNQPKGVGLTAGGECAPRLVRHASVTPLT